MCSASAAFPSFETPMLKSIYLRLSVTDRCNLRCAYCRPASGDACSSQEPLSSDEILRLVAATHDVVPVRKVRITGGEPLLRRDVVDIVRELRALLPAATLAMTTNGTRLGTVAKSLRDAGLDAVNVSLDTPDARSFSEVTRGGRVGDVLRGLAAARDAGFARLKINAVLMQSYSGNHLAELVRVALAHGAEPRFIELMPSGEGRHLFDRERLGASDALDRLARVFRYEGPAGRSGTAERHRFRDGDRVFVVGFISPVSMPFCDRCDRLRLDSHGALWGCLRQSAKVDLVGALRSGDPKALADLLSTVLTHKRAPDSGWAPGRMVAIGG